MQVTPVKFDPELVTGPADDMDAGRSPGLHLSQVYHSLEEELTGPRRDPMPLAQLKVYRAAGFIWERVMDRAFADSLANEQWVRPEEWVRDGIAASPDLINTRDWVLGETKFTWKSSKNIEEFKQTGTGKLWVWGVQMKGYCYLIGTQRARLFAYFVNGDYKTMQPQLHVNDFTFSQQELRENWQMILNHARKNKWL